MNLLVTEHKMDVVWYNIDVAGVEEKLLKVTPAAVMVNQRRQACIQEYACVLALMSGFAPFLSPPPLSVCLCLSVCLFSQCLSLCLCICLYL